MFSQIFVDLFRKAFIALAQHFGWKGQKGDSSETENLEEAFKFFEGLGVTKLLDAEDVLAHAEPKSITAYVMGSLFRLCFFFLIFSGSVLFLQVLRLLFVLQLCHILLDQPQKEKDLQLTLL